MLPATTTTDTTGTHMASPAAWRVLPPPWRFLLLQKLELGNNGLHAAPAEVGMSKQLQWLTLSNNILAAPPPFIGGLGQLQVLLLDHNQLRSLPSSGGFDGGGGSWSDSDSSRNRRGSASGAVAWPGALINLDLSYNPLAAIAADAFGRLTALQVLNLAGCGLEAIQGGTFAGLAALQELFLHSNRMTVLADNLFQGLAAISVLNLEGSGRLALGTFHPATFENLPTLTRLSLGGLGLTTLPGSLFTGLAKLLSLDLGSNPGLTALPEFLLQPLVSLQSLSLCGTSLGSSLPPDWLHDISVSVVSISLCDHAVSTFPNSRLATLTNLSFLDLHNTSVLPQSLTLSNAHLATYDLSSANISTFTQTMIAGLPKVTFLDLGFNPNLAIEPGAFSGAKAMEEIVLAGCSLGLRVGGLPVGALDGLVSLTNLDLSQNMLPGYDGSVVGSLPSLTTVNVVHNRLVRVPNFSGSSKLAALFLADNLITCIKRGDLETHTALMVLDLKVARRCHTIFTPQQC